MVKKTYPIKSDQLDVGTSQGQIPVLGAGGSLPAGIPVDSSSVTYNNTTSKLNATQLQALGDEMAKLHDNTLDPTGIITRGDNTLTFDDVTRTVTLAPTGTSFSYYIHGIEYVVTSPLTLVIPDVEGMYFVYIDVDGALHSTSIFSVDIILNFAYVSAIYWDATNKTGVYVADERHGITMDGQTHMHLHLSLGTQYISGFGLSNFVIDGNGTLATQAQFGADNGIIRDEDLQHTITSGSPQTLYPIAQVPIMWRSGANGNWRIKAADSYPIIYSGDSSGYVGASGLLPYNQWTGTTWQLTQLADADHVLVHYFATNDINHPFVGIHGINKYATITLARAGANEELSSLSGLPFQEFVPIGTVIFQTDLAFTNTPKAAVRSTDLGTSYVDWRNSAQFSSVGIFTDHGNLSGLSDDDHIQYHNDARGDARYYTQSQLNTRINHPSTGVFSGGNVTLGTGTGSPVTTNKFSIAAGVGLIVDNVTNPQNPTYQVVSWPAYNDVTVTNIATTDKTVVGITSAGTVFQQSTSASPQDHRTKIVLGTLAHFNHTSIEGIRSDGHPVYDINARFNDFGHSVGAFNISGNVYGADGASLSITKSAGTSYQVGSNFIVDAYSPDITTDPAASPVNFRYSYRNGSGGYTETTSTTLIDPGHYDNGTGTLATVSTNSWTAQIISYFPGADQHRIQYGQKVFASSSDALAAVPYISHQHNPILYEEGIIRGYLIVRGNATNLTLTTDAVFVEAAKFSGAGGTIPPLTGHAYDLQTAGASQSIFTTAFTFAPTANGRTYLSVYVNRTKQIEGGSYDYTVTGTNQITFVTPLTGGEVVEFYGL